MSKLQSEKRIKAVDNITSSSQGDPVNFEEGDIVYDLTSNSFKKKSGAIGSGSWANAVSAGAVNLDALTDVDLTGLSDSDIGDQLTYSYIDPSHTFTWRSGTTIKVTMSKTGKRGSSGNNVAIAFVNEGSSSGGVASYNSSSNGTFSIKYENNVTTAAQIKTAIDGVSDFSCVITGTTSVSANSADGGITTSVNFSSGAERWMSAAAGGGGGTTNLGYTAGTRELSSSTGNNVQLPLSDTNTAGLMSDTQFDKLDGIAAGAEVNVQSNWTAASGDAQILNKPSIPVDLTADGTGTVHPNNYTNTTYSAMSSGNSYASGLVIAGSSSHSNQFLRKDGTWQSVSSSFVGLSDTPSAYAGSQADANKFLKINGTGNGVVFTSVTVPANISDLGDVDAIGSDANRGKFLKVKTGSDAIEYVAATIPTTIGALGDVAVIGGGDANKFAKVNAGSNAIEYVTVSVPTNISDLGDVGAIGSNTNRGKVLKVASSSDAVVYSDIVSQIISWTIGTDGSNTAYKFTGQGFSSTESNPTIYVVRGQKYQFVNSLNAHPFRIANAGPPGGTSYNLGITGNSVSNGTLTWEVRMDAPSTLYYYCTSHSAMSGEIKVLDSAGSLNINGTPVNNQLAVWTNGTTLEGDDALSWNGTDKELTIGYDAANYHALKRTANNLDMNLPMDVFKYLMFNQAHSLVATLGGNGLNVGTQQGTSTTSPGVDFTGTQPTATTSQGVTGFSHRYANLDYSQETISMNVSSAVKAGVSSVVIYFQLRTVGFTNSSAADIFIDHRTNSAALSLNSTTEIDNEAGSWITPVANGDSNFSPLKPVYTGSGGHSQANESVRWYKVTFTDGTGDLDTLHELIFRHTATNGMVAQIANFHVVGGNTTDDAIFSVSKFGYIELPQEVQKQASNPSRGTRIYTNRDGTLSAHGSNGVSGPISVGFRDFSWCGGFNSTSSFIRYIPVVGTEESTSILPEDGQKIVVRDGELVKAVFRCSVDAGSTHIRLYVNGSNIGVARTVTTTWVDTNTTGNVAFRYKLEANFSGATFATGDVIKIGCDPNISLGGDVIFATEILYTS